MGGRGRRVDSPQQQLLKCKAKPAAAKRTTVEALAYFLPVDETWRQIHAKTTAKSEELEALCGVRP